MENKQKNKELISDIILLIVIIMLAVVVGLYAYPSIKNTLNIDTDPSTSEQESNTEKTSKKLRMATIHYDEESEEVIIDTAAPIINGNTTFTTKNTTKASIESFLATLTIIDKSDVTHLIIKDDYTPNYEKPGEYVVEVLFVDTNNNSTTIELTIIVKDVMAPVFYNYSGKPTNTLKVIKAANTLLTIDDITKNITCIDDVDGNVTEFKIISDSYTGNGDKVGSYEVKICASDKYENKSILTITIYVSELENIVVYDAKKIVVPSNVKLSKDDISNVLYACGYYSNETTTYINVNYEEYLSTYDTPNTYSAECNLNSTSGENKTVYLTIEVISASESDVVSNSSSLIKRMFTSFWNFLKKIFEFIGSLLEKVF